MNKNKKNVTIIITVYKDFTTLKKCIQSLKKFVDPRHKILMVNDSSPETNMEKDILEEIGKDSRFNYYKNSQNLGFVRTCNKAVKELDKSNNDILLLNSDTEVTDNFLEEMIDILYACEKHGIVCPRSNNATILSIPLNYDEDRNKITNNSYECYLKIKNLLPRFNIIPTAVGFCMLIKRELINRYGFFDEIYSPGYNEENDFSMRINRYGYSPIMANHSFVFHHETKSFTLQEKKELNEKNQKILLERYPYYLNLVSNYLNYQINPVDHFSDVIDNSFSKKTRILFSLYNLPASHNGTSEYGLSLLSNFIEKYKDKYDIDVLTTQAGAEFHKLSEKYSNIFYPDTISKHYSITICPSQIFDIRHLLLLNKFSLRILVTMQDIISLRCRYLYIENPSVENLFALTLMASDGIISLTNYSTKDLLTYFEPLSTDNKKTNIRVIPHGISNEVHDFEKYKHEIPFEEYVLIVGNDYHDHKSVKDCINHLQDMEINFCVLGCSDLGKKNVKCYRGGFLNGEFIDALYHFANLVIFPSTYEGFGLPLIKSIFHSKKVVVLDNEINREISNDHGKENFLFFKAYDEIKDHILNCKKTPFRKNNKARTWEDVADDTEKFVEEILHTRIDSKALEKRWYSLLSIEQQIRQGNQLITAALFSPHYLQPPNGWVGHLPFAARVIQEVSPKIFVELGTHSGNSYFSFCQSVFEAGLSTKCYAVDTWQGDEHAEKYGEEIFAKVDAHNEERYAGFSRLLRMTFDDAVTHFADGSIGLLHIDGLHTYEAVRHDFDTWLPKLAPGAVVMLHDTNVCENDFGVWKLWKELQERYPSNLEFMHSYGLGVLQLNNAPDNKRLTWLQPNSPEKLGLINYFAAMGYRQMERFELNELKQHAANLNQMIADRDGQISALHHSTSWRITWPLRIIERQLIRCRRVAELALPAIQHGGGLKSTLKKAIWLYRHEGLAGIKRGFRSVAASHILGNLKDIDPVYLQVVSHPAEELLAVRVLIIAEMSIPQCKKYRVQQKHDLFQFLGIDCTMLNWIDTQACLNALQTHSQVIFYRVPAYDKVLSIINEAKRLRLPTIWEVDDLIFDKEVLIKSKTILSLDKGITDQLVEGAGLYRKAMLLCDEGIASTTGLADAMKQAGLPEVHLVENALDRQTLEVAQKVCHDHTFHRNGIVRIVYGSGTNTHNVDFQEAAPAIIKILDKFPNVRLRLIGLLDLPEIFSRYEEQVERLPTCTYEEYMTALAGCDISITPLENYIFNDSKSNIKYLEASIVKVPSVCSPRAAFAQVINHGKNGFLCETDDEWEAALTLLVTDTTKRDEVGEAAYSTVMQNYLPESIARQQVAPLLVRHKRNPDTLRVLSVNCYYYPRSFGGATIVAEEVNKRINAQDGFQIHVFTALPSSVTPPYTIRRYEADGINVYGVGLPDRLDEKTQFENPEIVDAFDNVLAVVQPDIVHFHSIQGIGVSVVDLCARKGIKYVVTLHDAWWLCGRQFMITKQGKYCEQKKIDLTVCATCVDNNHLNLYRSERLIAALRNASALLTPSRFFADFHIANGFTNVQVNKNGILKPCNTLRFRREGPLRFGYVGGNTKVKGFHLVKKVFSDLAGSNVRLVLVDNMLNLGFASYHQQDLVGIPNAEIVPAYTQSNIDDFFANIDVLLFPTQGKESFGLTVREALARNVWVIATDAGGVIEDIEPGQNGYIVPFWDTGEGLKQAVIDTLGHFERITPGEEVSLGATNITFFEDQAAELAAMLKQVGARDSDRDAHVF
jgi:O-antigen biosynthesis protein